MTDARFIAIVTMVGALAGPVIGFANTFLAHRHEQRNAQTRQKVDVLVEQTNGISQRLVAATGKVEFERGLKQGEDNPR